MPGAEIVLAGELPDPLACTPAHPRPQAGESLTSLALRAAHANGLAPQAYAAAVLGDRTLWMRDPDRVVDENLLSAFAKANLMDVGEVQATTLSALTGRLFADLHPTGHTRWVLPLGIYGAPHHRPGSLYCPQCLAAGRACFHLAWRLSFMTGCPVHGALLQNACPQCGAAVAYHRRALSARPETLINPEPITLCWHCGSDLAGAPRQGAPHAAAVGLQAQLTAAAATGQIEWAGQRVPALDFSDVVCQITRLIGTAGRAPRLRDLAVARTQQTWPPAPRRFRVLELLSLEERHTALALTGTLLGSLNTFLDACEDVKLSASRVLRDMQRRPAWFEQAVGDHLGSRRASRTFRGHWERGLARATQVPLPQGGQGA